MWIPVVRSFSEDRMGLWKKSVNIKNAWDFCINCATFQGDSLFP